MYSLTLSKLGTITLPANLPLWVQPGFLQAVSELHGVEALHLICRKGEQCVALMPIYERRNLGLRRQICPLSSYYQGIWFFWQESRQSNRDMLDELKISGEIALFLKKRYLRSHFKLAPHNRDVRGFTWNRFRAIPLYTFVHELGQPLALLADERKNLKEALAEDYTFTEDFRQDDFIELMKLLHQRKVQSFGLDYASFARWMKTLREQGLLTQFNLLRGSDVISSNLLLGGSADQTCYSIMISTLPEEMKKGASTLHYLKLAEALTGRFRQLDCCGANVPDVARFKAALGLQLMPFHLIRSG